MVHSIHCLLKCMVMFVINLCYFVLAMLSGLIDVDSTNFFVVSTNTD